jgi:hypothetical protein
MDVAAEHDEGARITGHASLSLRGHRGRAPIIRWAGVPADEGQVDTIVRVTLL